MLVHLLLIEEYEQGVLRKDLIIEPFVERFKTATLRMSYWQLPLVLRAIRLTISFLSTYS